MKETAKNNNLQSEYLTGLLCNALIFYFLEFFCRKSVFVVVVVVYNSQLYKYYCTVENKFRIQQGSMSYVIESVPF